MFQSKKPSFFDIRKIAISLVIAVLFTILVFSTINAFYPHPDYSDYCQNERFPKPVAVGGESCEEITEPTKQEIATCTDGRGSIVYNYDGRGCPTSFYCERCYEEYDNARDQHNHITFIFASILAVIAIILGMILPREKNSIHEWIGTGFMLGGLLTLFIATAMVFGDLNRFLKPVVIFVELCIVIWLTYKKLGDSKK